jgi:hypothetical protein
VSNTSSFLNGHQRSVGRKQRDIVIKGLDEHLSKITEIETKTHETVVLNSELLKSQLADIVAGITTDVRLVVDAFDKCILRTLESIEKTSTAARNAEAKAIKVIKDQMLVSQQVLCQESEKNKNDLAVEFAKQSFAVKVALQSKKELIHSLWKKSILIFLASQVILVSSLIYLLK